MSNAQEAFAMTAVLFGLSFAGIFLFWFVGLSEGRQLGVSSRFAKVTSRSPLRRPCRLVIVRPLIIDPAPLAAPPQGPEQGG